MKRNAITLSYDDYNDMLTSLHLNEKIAVKDFT